MELTLFQLAATNIMRRLTGHYFIMHMNLFWAENSWSFQETVLHLANENKIMHRTHCSMFTLLYFSIIFEKSTVKSLKDSLICYSKNARNT